VLHVYPGPSTNLPFFHFVGALEADTPTSGIFVIMLPSHFFLTSIGAATEIADLPGFYVRIIPTADSLFNVSKLNVSTRNNVRAYTKGDMTALHMFLFFFIFDNLCSCSLKLVSIYHSFGL